MPSGSPPLPIASPSAGAAAAVACAPVAATSTLRAAPGSAPNAQVRLATGSKYVCTSRVARMLGLTPPRTRRARRDVAARAAAAAGHAEKHADRAHRAVVAGRRAQPPRDAAQHAVGDVDLLAGVLRRDRARRPRRLGQRRRRGRPDRVARGERGRHEDQHRDRHDDAAPPAGQARAARRPAPGAVQVAPQLGEDRVGVARAAHGVASAGPPGRPARRRSRAARARRAPARPAR